MTLDKLIDKLYCREKERLTLRKEAFKQIKNWMDERFYKVTKKELSEDEADNIFFSEMHCTADKLKSITTTMRLFLLDDDNRSFLRKMENYPGDLSEQRILKVLNIVKKEMEEEIV